MRTRMPAIVVVAVLIVAAVAVTSRGTASDADEERLADLETRVAALETAVATNGNGADGQDGEDGQSGSSSSSTQQTSTSFTGVYSGSGDRTIEIDLNHAGTYQLTLTAPEGASVMLLDANDVPVDAFAIETEPSGTGTGNARLESGAYRLEVQSGASWSVTLLRVV